MEPPCKQFDGWACDDPARFLAEPSFSDEDISQVFVVCPTGRVSRPGFISGDTEYLAIEHRWENWMAYAVILAQPGRGSGWHFHRPA